MQRRRAHQRQMWRKRWNGHAKAERLQPGYQAGRSELAEERVENMGRYALMQEEWQLHLLPVFPGGYQASPRLERCCQLQKNLGHVTRLTLNKSAPQCERCQRKSSQQERFLLSV
jgi:hypothetical protein